MLSVSVLLHNHLNIHIIHPIPILRSFFCIAFLVEYSIVSSFSFFFTTSSTRFHRLLSSCSPFAPACLPACIPVKNPHSSTASASFLILCIYYCISYLHPSAFSLSFPFINSIQLVLVRFTTHIHTPILYSSYHSLLLVVYVYPNNHLSISFLLPTTHNLHCRRYTRLLICM